jgi:pantoate--beta-alanine ligase
VVRVLEGTRRPGHFEGVATVVAKLLNATQPDRAYFGQKDAQQSVVIRRMVADLNFPVEVVICPTVREADGLALSSRNAYLDPDQRSAAVVLYQALCAAREAYQAGERSSQALRERMAAVIRRQPLAEMQYVSCAHPQTLQELERVDRDMLLSMAVFVGKTRLIDNFLLQDGAWLGGESVRRNE